MRIELVLIVSLCAAAAPTRADAAGDAAAAEALFQEGRRLLKEGRYQEACGKLEASHRLDASFGALMNMGDCYLKLGRTASAWAAYREAGDLARKHDDRGRARLAEARSAPLEPRLARLVILVNADHDVGSYEVRRDGQPVDPAVLGMPIPVDPGEYEIEAGGRDVEVWRSRVKIEQPGAQVTERITLRRAEPAAPAPAPAAEPTAVEEVHAAAPAAAPSSSRFVITAESGIGYGSTSSGDLDASVHGLELHVRLGGGYRAGRLVVLGALTLSSAADPALTFQGREATGDLSMSAISLSAGAGYQATSRLLLAGLLRLTKVNVTMSNTSFDSSFGPGFEFTAGQELYRRGPWGLSVVGSVGLASVSVERTSWTALSAGIGLAGSYL